MARDAARDVTQPSITWHEYSLSRSFTGSGLLAYPALPADYTNEI